MRLGQMRRRRVVAVLLALLFLGVPAVAIDADLSNLVELVKGMQSGQEDPTKSPAFLQNLSNELGLSALSTDMPAVPSHVLGAPTVPQALPMLYEKRARASSTPLADALSVWRDTLGVDGFEDEIATADRFDPDALVAFSILVYALTDATELQKRALADLSPSEKAELMAAPEELLRAGFSDLGYPDLSLAARHAELASRVDMGLIHAGAQIMVASTEYVLPALREWAEMQRGIRNDGVPHLRFIEGLLADFDEATIDRMPPHERIQILREAIAQGAGLAGFDAMTPSTDPLRPPPGAPLSAYILDLIDIVGTESPGALIEKELERADELPEGQQDAIILTLVNYIRWRLVVGSVSTGIGDGNANDVTGELVEATLKLLAAAEETSSMLSQPMALPMNSQAASSPIPVATPLDDECEDEGDLYPSEVEDPLGTDSCDPNDYPAGLPERPDALPSSQPWPPVDGVPAGSPFIVRIPGIMAIGDTSTTTYDRGAEYDFILDLGGDDTYSNNVASSLQFAMDLGGNDTYDSPGDAQGFNGILIDLSGNDRYSVAGRGQAAATGGGVGSPDLRGVGILFDSDGDDIYQASGTLSHGSIDGRFAVGNAIAILMDAAGKDRYDARMQASIPVANMLDQQSGLHVPSHRLALFLEMGGSDEYQPVGNQAQFILPTTNNGCGSLLAGDAAAFVDASGDDIYAGSWQGGTRHLGPDRSNQYNGHLWINQAARPLSGTCTGFHSDTAAVGLFWDMEGAVENVDAESLDIPGLGIKIAGAGSDRHQHDYALLVEPGGDDTYLNNAGSTILRTTHAAGTGVVADSISGDTNTLMHTTTQDAFSIAAILVDLEGSDTYQGGDAARIAQPLRDPANLADDALGLKRQTGILTQGAGFLGTGILVDSAGDDSYEARSMAQGFGFLGNGVLWDRQGDDRYATHLDIARQPSVDGGHAAWQEFASGQWVIKARKATETCSYSIVPNDARFADAIAPIVGGDFVLYSVYDQQEDVWNILRVAAPAPSCNGPDGFVNVQNSSTEITTFNSNQLNPRFAAAGVIGVIWQDDRGGDWDLYRRDPRVSINPEALLIAGPAGTNQVEPWVADDDVFWQDDRTGRWDIFHASTGSPGQQEALSAGVPGNHSRPRASETTVAWERQLTPSGDLDLVVKNRLTGEITIVGGPGDQHEPSLSGNVVLFTDEPPNSPPRIMRLDLSTGQAVLVRDDARQPSVDAHDANSYLFVGTDGFDGVPASRYWEVRKGGLASSTTPPFLSFTRNPSRSESFMVQGAAWQAGTGLLVEEGGLDTYLGGWHAQGAAFSTGQPDNRFRRDRTSDHLQEAVHALLVDLEGNDKYGARRASQGAVFGLEVQRSISPPSSGGEPDPITELDAAQRMGLLLDMRGSDSYVAERWAQGYGAHLVGQTAYTGPPDAVAPNPDPRTYAVNAVALLADLGGSDAYQYAPGSTGYRVSRLGDLATCAGTTEAAKGQFNADHPPTFISTVESACNPIDALAPTTEPTINVTSPLETTLDPRGDGDRQNSIWRQKTREDPENQPGGARDLDDKWFDNPVCLPNVERACPPVVHVGGIGMDLPIIDNLEQGLRAKGNQLLELQLEAHTLDPGSGEAIETSTLRGPVMLEATIDQQHDIGLVVERVEFFIADRFFGYGEPVAPCPGFPCKRSVQWQTDQEAYPDEDYEVRARAHYGLPSLAGITLLGSTIGFAENTTVATLDNPPRIIDPQLTTTLFSPFPYAQDHLLAPNLTFGLSQDHPSRGGHGWVKVEANPLDSVGEPVVLLPFQPAAQHTNVTWDGLGEQGQLIPSGPYSLTVTATDRDPATNPDLIPERTTVYDDAIVELDRSPPQGGCVHLLDLSLSPDDPEAVGPCNAATLVSLPNAGGNTRRNQNGQTVATFVLRFTYDGAWDDIRRVHFYEQSEGDAAWAHRVLDEVQGWQIELGTGQNRTVMILVEDRAGNLECAPACGATPSSPLPVGDPDFLNATRDVKATIEGAAASFRVDLIAPVLGIDPQEFFHFNGSTRRITDTPRLGPVSDVTIPFRVIESESAPAAAVRASTFEDEALLETEHFVPLQPIGNGVYAGQWENWTDVAGLGWPEGFVDLQLLAEDQAGNPATPIPSTVILDRTQPHVDAIDVRFPDGRRHAVDGDTVQVIVTAHDPPVAGVLIVPNSELALQIDASQVSNQEGASAVNLDYRPSLDRFEGTFVIGHPDLDFSGLQAETRLLPLFIDDGAGNTNESVIRIALGDPQIGLILESTELDFDRISLNISTVKSASIVIEYESAGDTITLPATPAGRTHEIHLNDLEPDTSYVFRILATDLASGAAEALEATLHTLLGVQAAILQPVDGAVLSGLVPIRGNAFVIATAADPRVLLTLEGDNLTDGRLVLMDEVAQGGSFALDLVTNALPDGTYDLVANATHAGELKQAITEQITIDNTPPVATFVEPMPQSVLPSAPDRVLVHVRDNLTALQVGSAQLFADGIQIEADVLFHAEGLGEALLEWTGLPDLPEGPHRMEARIQDIAGNPASVSAQVSIDASAPASNATRIEYVDGHLAARPGEVVRVVTSGTQAATRVTVNASALGYDQRLQLTRTTHGHGMDLLVPGGMKDGSYPFLVTVTRASGLSHDTLLQMVIDTSPPTVLGWRAIPSSMSTATVVVGASEAAATRAQLTTADGAPLSLRVEDTELIPPIDEPWTEDAFLQALVLNGLDPGESYQLTLTLIDRAGNQGETHGEFRFVPVVEEPVHITGATALVAASGHVRLHWSTEHAFPPLSLEYVVYAFNGSQFQPIAVLNHPTFIHAPTPGTTQQYFVASRNLEGRTGPPSDIVQVTIPKKAHLSNPTVAPSVGVADQTSFRFTVEIDGTQEQNPDVWLLVAGTPKRMTKTEPSSDCRQTCTFAGTATLPPLSLAESQLDLLFQVIDGETVLETMPPQPQVLGPATKEANEQASAIGLLAAAMLVAAMATFSRRRT